MVCALFLWYGVVWCGVVCVICLYDMVCVCVIFFIVVVWCGVFVLCGGVCVSAVDILQYEIFSYGYRYLFLSESFTYHQKVSDFPLLETGNKMFLNVFST